MICTNSFYSQESKTEKINIGIIVSKTDEILAEFLYKDINSVYEIKEYQFDFKFGENIINEKASKIDTLKFNEKGFLKFNNLKADFLRYKNGTCTRTNLLDYPVTIGKQGEILSANYLRYSYNKKGKIVELKEYSKDGSDLEKHYEFVYNLKNQIVEVKELANSCTIISNKIDSYFYDEKGNISEVINYQKTNDKNFPKRIFHKLIYKYNSKNQLISFHSYENNYGEHYMISNANLSKYVNGKRVIKTLVENNKDLNSAYHNTQNFKYSYENNTNNWYSRIEYMIDNNKKDIKAMNMILQTKL